MFFFKCCSSHSLPSFLKSSKNRTSPSKSPAKLSSPNYNESCSNELVKKLPGDLSKTSSETTESSTDDDFGNVDVGYKKSSKPPKENISKKRPISAKETGKHLLVNSVEIPRKQIQTGSSSCVVLLVEDNKVKTSLVKHYSSLPNNCFLDSICENINKPKVVSKKITNSKLENSQNKTDFDAQADHGEYILRRATDRTQIELDELLVLEKMGQETIYPHEDTPAKPRNDFDGSTHSSLFCSTDSDGYLSTTSNYMTSTETGDLLCHSTLSDLSTRSLSNEILEISSNNNSQLSVLQNESYLGDTPEKSKYWNELERNNCQVSFKNSPTFSKSCSADRDLCDKPPISSCQADQFAASSTAICGESQATYKQTSETPPEVLNAFETAQNPSNRLHGETAQGTSNVFKRDDISSVGILNTMNESVVSIEYNLVQHVVSNNLAEDTQALSTNENEDSARNIKIEEDNNVYHCPLAEESSRLEGSERTEYNITSFKPLLAESQPHSTNAAIDYSSLSLMLAGESATFLEGFVLKEDYFPPVHFTIVSDDNSTSSSNDSIKNTDGGRKSNDDLFSNNSKTELVVRPSNFGENEIILANSFETKHPCVPDGTGNQCDSNCTADSSIESPEYPSGGIDFQHFYSKSLPNLNNQPYNSMSSLSLIEEYFNRYIIECETNDEDGTLGSQVDPKPDLVSPESEEKVDSTMGYCDNQCRQHSLEKLTEICKKFSSSYMNFFQANRGENDATAANDYNENQSDITATNEALKEDVTALSALYAAIFPHSDTRDASSTVEISVDSTLPKELPPLKKKPSLVGRSVSLKGTPESGAKKVVGNKKKKAVKFADSFGLELAIVRLILSGESLSDQDIQQRFHATNASCCNNHHKDSKHAIKFDNRRIVPEFIQPGNSDDFIHRVEAQNVLLESCLPEEKSRSVSGCIRVSNLSYEKEVTVRYTLNDWLSYNETSASYVYVSNDGPTDRFSFSIKLPSFFDVGSALEFVILYRAQNGREFWDNNNTLNYRMTCQKF